MALAVTAHAVAGAAALRPLEAQSEKPRVSHLDAEPGAQTRDADGLAVIAGKVRDLGRRVGALRGALGGSQMVTVGAPARSTELTQRADRRQACCAPQVADVGAGIAAVGADVQRLRAAYRRARHPRGLRLAAELDAQVQRLGRSLDSLAVAPDEHSARAAATHLAAGIEAMLQTIADGRACCAIRLDHTARPLTQPRRDP